MNSVAKTTAVSNKKRTFNPNASNLRFVVPAKAGTQLCARQTDCREKKGSNLILEFCFKDKSPLPRVSGSAAPSVGLSEAGPFFKGGRRLVSQACPPL